MKRRLFFLTTALTSMFLLSALTIGGVAFAGPNAEAEAVAKNWQANMIGQDADQDATQSNEQVAIVGAETSQGCAAVSGDAASAALGGEANSLAALIAALFGEAEVESEADAEAESEATSGDAWCGNYSETNIAVLQDQAVIQDQDVDQDQDQGAANVGGDQEAEAEAEAEAEDD